MNAWLVFVFVVKIPGADRLGKVETQVGQGRRGHYRTNICNTNVCLHH